MEKAAYIGIVSGVGGNRFDPAGTVTREQGAVMLARLSDALNFPFQAHPVWLYDYDYISPWALESVRRVVAVGIMSGNIYGKFEPQQPHTREHSIANMLRMFTVANLQDIQNRLAEEVREYMAVNFSEYALINIEVRSTGNFLLHAGIYIEIEERDEETYDRIIDAVFREFHRHGSLLLVTETGVNALTMEVSICHG